MTSPLQDNVAPADPPLSPRHVTVGSVNWRSVLDFIQLFRGFRLAINPAKIVLALLAILLIYSAGRLFDAAWGPQVYGGELEAFVRDKPEIYRAARAERIRERHDSLRDLLLRVTGQDSGFTTEQLADLPDHPRAAFRALKGSYIKQFYSNLKTAHDDTVEQQQRQEEERKKKEERKRERGGKEESSMESAAEGSKSFAEIEQEKRARAAKVLEGNVLRAREVAGYGISDSFLKYELKQFDALVDNTLTFVRVVPVSSVTATDLDGEGQALSGGLLTKKPERLWRSDTIVGCLANMTITAPVWLFSGTAPMQWRPENADTWGGWMKMLAYRAVYLASLLLLAIFSLLVLALTGATIARMSAMELAGIERAPVVDAFRFSLRRLWIFVKAPITPFLILLVVGLFLAALGLIGAVPWIGEIILGMLFIVFIAIGFVLMLLLLGVLGGFNLLYPTVAVEGSDAFDAMSRSFAYVYARPWRLIFYTVVSLIYGVITYLFVSFAVYIILLVTHTFVGWGTNLFGFVYGANSGLPKLDTLWRPPQFMRLIEPANWYAMSWSEYFGSMFLHFWVYLLISAIGAYVISYYFSTHTIIYLLLRRSVDGQSTTEIFTEDTTEPVDEAELAPHQPAAPAPLPASPTPDQPPPPPPAAA